MIASRKILAAAVLGGFALAMAGLTVSTVADSAHAVGVGQESGMAEAGVASKGDLQIGARCAGQSWPDVAPACLIDDGGVRARPVRTVTIGHQIGEATTVLIRLPEPQVARR